jgi:hypothetical protein
MMGLFYFSLPKPTFCTSHSHRLYFPWGKKNRWFFIIFMCHEADRVFTKTNWAYVPMFDLCTSRKLFFTILCVVWIENFLVLLCVLPGRHLNYLFLFSLNWIVLVKIVVLNFQTLRVHRLWAGSMLGQSTRRHSASQMKGNVDFPKPFHFFHSELIYFKWFYLFVALHGIFSTFKLDMCTSWLYYFYF